MSEGTKVSGHRDHLCDTWERQKAQSEDSEGIGFARMHSPDKGSKDDMIDTAEKRSPDSSCWPP